MKSSLGPEEMSPALVQKVVRHGGEDSFDEAREDLREDVGLEISAKQIQRITERVGSEWAAARDEGVELFKQGKLPRLYGQRPAVGAVMADGRRILTRASEQGPGVHEPQWKEPKYGCCLTLNINTKQSRADPQPEPPSKFLDPPRVARIVRETKSRSSTGSPTQGSSTQPSKKKQRKKRGQKRKATAQVVRTVIASMRVAEEFGYMLATESYLRNLDLAQRKAYVCDGLPYNWKIWSEHFQASGFVPILDFFLHLLTYLYDAAQALGGGNKKQWVRYERWLRLAWDGGREKLWAELCTEATKMGKPPKKASDTDPRRLVADGRSI